MVLYASLSLQDFNLWSRHYRIERKRQIEREEEREKEIDRQIQGFIRTYWQNKNEIQIKLYKNKTIKTKKKQDQRKEHKDN